MSGGLSMSHGKTKEPETHTRRGNMQTETWRAIKNPEKTGAQYLIMRETGRGSLEGVGTAGDKETAERIAATPNLARVCSRLMTALADETTCRANPEIGVPNQAYNAEIYQDAEATLKAAGFDVPQITGKTREAIQKAGGGA